MKRKPKTISSDATVPKKHHWAMGLLVSMEDPQYKVKEDDKVTVIKDKYPKAQYHYLVIPKADIPSLWHIKKENEDLLIYMHCVAEDLIRQHKESEFLYVLQVVTVILFCIVILFYVISRSIGYHAVPSMQRLHLHVISTDFNSPCLKTKYHWNSFTTPFFLHSAGKYICIFLTENIQKIHVTFYES